MKRKGNSADPAEVEKLLNERNAGGSYKSHLKGTGIFYLLTIIYSMSNSASENSVSICTTRFTFLCDVKKLILSY